VLQGVAGCCRVLQGVAGCYRVLQGVAGCCRVLQCVVLSLATQWHDTRMPNVLRPTFICVYMYIYIYIYLYICIFIYIYTCKHVLGGKRDQRGQRERAGGIIQCMCMRGVWQRKARAELGV